MSYAAMARATRYVPKLCAITCVAHAPADSSLMRAFVRSAHQCRCPPAIQAPTPTKPATPVNHQGERSAYDVHPARATAASGNAGCTTALTTPPRLQL